VHHVVSRRPMERLDTVIPTRTRTCQHGDVSCSVRASGCMLQQQQRTSEWSYVAAKGRGASGSHAVPKGREATSDTALTRTLTLHRLASEMSRRFEPSLPMTVPTRSARMVIVHRPGSSLRTSSYDDDRRVLLGFPFVDAFGEADDYDEERQAGVCVFLCERIIFLRACPRMEFLPSLPLCVTGASIHSARAHTRQGAHPANATQAQAVSAHLACLSGSLCSVLVLGTDGTTSPSQ